MYFIKLFATDKKESTYTASSMFCQTLGYVISSNMAVAAEKSVLSIFVTVIGGECLLRNSASIPLFSMH